MEPLAVAAICDDLRMEATGKPFIIGMYPQIMNFASLPAAVPQIFVLVTVFSDIKKPILKYTVHITAPGMNITHEHNSGTLQPSPFQDVTRAEVSVAVPIRPFIVTAPGVLTVTIKHAEGELRARRLLLQLASQPNPPHLFPQELGKPGQDTRH